jgi:hypothetical protein
VTLSLSSAAPIPFRSKNSPVKATGLNLLSECVPDDEASVVMPALPNVSVMDAAQGGDDDEERREDSESPEQELCAMHAAPAASTDLSTLPCNQELLRGVGACKKGATCPYSHDPVVLKAAWVEIYNKHYRR